MIRVMDGACELYCHEGKDRKCLKRRIRRPLVAILGERQNGKYDLWLRPRHWKSFSILGMIVKHEASHEAVCVVKT